MGLFDYTAGKIKMVAVIGFYVGVALSLILSIVFLLLGSNGYAGGILMGILCMILGPICSWVGSLLLYGFGRLIDNLDELRCMAEEEKAAKGKEEAQQSLHS